ncbi:MAG: Ig-like domain-containing protein [Burkholderiales bacterium]
MKMISALARYVALILSLAVATAHADVLLSITDQLAAPDATQSGRLSRNGIPQDWAGSEPFPGPFNIGQINHYRTYAVNVGVTPYIQVILDSPATTTFVSAYLTSYVPGSAGAPNYGLDINWLGDAGGSGNSFLATDPRFFAAAVPVGSTVIIVVNETTPNGGLGLPYNLRVEGFTDRTFGLSSTALSSITLVSNLNPGAAGRAITLTATVSDPNTPPAGSVRFDDGAVAIPGCAAVTLVGTGLSKTAQCVIILAPGLHNLTATYLPSSRLGVGNPITSNTVAETINPPVATTTTVVSLPNPSIQGALVTSTATVVGSLPTGTVQFVDSVTATAIPGCNAVALTGSGNTRTAVCNTTTLSLGAHTITGNYSGDAANAPSNGAAPLQVNACTGRSCGT